MKNQGKAYLFAGLTILCWSTVASAFKISLRYQSHLQLLTGSVLISFILFTSILIVQGKIKTVFGYSTREYAYSAFLGFLNPFAYYLILFKAYSLLPAQLAQPLNMTWPVILVIISIPLLNQKIGMKSILSILVSFTGVILVSSQGGGGNFNPGQLPGIILAIGSSLIWAVFWLLNVKDKRDEVAKLSLNFFFALLFMTIISPFVNDLFPRGREAWMGSVYVGFFEMGLAFIFWLKALTYSETTDKISHLIYLSPFLSLIFIHYIVGEKIFITTIAGLIIIIAGILLQNLNTGKITWYRKK